MTMNSKENSRASGKPYITGSIIDESAPKSILVFFGSLLLVAFMCFLVSATTAAASFFIRLLINLVMILLILFIFFNSGASQGTEAVTRGEILHQRREKGMTYTEAEKKMCFHKGKGFLYAFLGTLPLLIAAVILAFVTEIQTTDSGTLPSWIQGYLNRDEIGSALIHYTNPDGLGFIDYLRLIVRISLMPYVNIAGASNHVAVLWVERLSPLFQLLPAISFGIGYLTGTSNRVRIHQAISQSNRERAKRERKERKKRLSGEFRPKGPQQLN